MWDFFKKVTGTFIAFGIAIMALAFVFGIITGIIAHSADDTVPQQDDTVSYSISYSAENN